MDEQPEEQPEPLNRAQRRARKTKDAKGQATPKQRINDMKAGQKSWDHESKPTLRKATNTAGRRHQAG